MNPDARLPEAIVFDVDGTFYYQSPVRWQMTLRLARYCLGSPFAGWRAVRLLSAYRRAQESLRLSGADNSPSRQLELACSGLRIGPDVARGIIDEWMGARPLDLLPACARKGLREFIEATRKRGIRLGIFSDYPAAAKLRAFQFETLFDCVLSAQDSAVSAFKPSPAGLLECLRLLGVRPENSLYIGDRPEIDGEAARRAGIKAYIVGLPESATGPGWTGVPDFNRLQEILGL